MFRLRYLWGRLRSAPDFRVHAEGWLDADGRRYPAADWTSDPVRDALTWLEGFRQGWWPIRGDRVAAAARTAGEASVVGLGWDGASDIGCSHHALWEPGDGGRLRVGLAPGYPPDVSGEREWFETTPEDVFSGLVASAELALAECERAGLFSDDAHGLGKLLAWAQAQPSGDGG